MCQNILLIREIKKMNQNPEKKKEKKLYQLNINKI